MDDTSRSVAGRPPAAPSADPRDLTAEARCALLLEISRRSRRTLDLGETLDLLLDAVASVVDYDAAGIFALNEDLFPAHDRPQGVIAGVAYRGFPSRPLVADAMLREGRGLVGHAIRTGHPVLVPDVARDSRYVVGREATRSEVVVPITVDGRTIAALNLESDQLAAFDARHLASLAFFAEAAALAIEKSMLHRHLLALQREKDERDLQLRIAGEVQLGLLPASAPVLPGWDLAARCLPSLELGGDYFDYLPLPDGRLGVVIADVAGKGIPAALIMATFRALLRARYEMQSDLAAAITDVGRLLRASASHRAFVTCCFVILDPASGELEYASCGHPLALLDRADGSREELANCGPAIGAFEAAEYTARRTVLAPGDRLVMYTDGLIETATPGGDPVGPGPLLATLDSQREVSAAQLIAVLLETVASGTAAPSASRPPGPPAASDLPQPGRPRPALNGTQLSDDLTLVVLQRLRTT